MSSTDNSTCPWLSSVCLSASIRPDAPSRLSTKSKKCKRRSRSSLIKSQNHEIKGDYLLTADMAHESSSMQVGIYI